MADLVFGVCGGGDFAMKVEKRRECRRGREQKRRVTWVFS